MTNPTHRTAYDLHATKDIVALVQEEEIPGHPNAPQFRNILVNTGALPKDNSISGGPDGIDHPGPGKRLPQCNLVPTTDNLVDKYIYPPYPVKAGRLR
jgi:hypothetical protein